MSSLAQYTGTRIDSSAKHIVACRVSEKFFQKFVDRQDVLNRKDRYAMMKDEIVLNVGRSTVKETALPDDEFQDDFQKHAYPSVLTTLGDIGEEMQAGIAGYYRNMAEGPARYIRYSVGRPPQWKVFPFLFNFQGVAVGKGYASDMSGDNVASVMIGGMATVLNGHFQCYTGELVQWYFDFEKREFDADGNRLLAADAVNRWTNPAGPEAVGNRESWQRQRMFGEYKENNNGKKNVALVKAIRPRLEGDDTDFITGDRTRVFGKVVNGGRPWEPIDVFICNVYEY